DKLEPGKYEIDGANVFALVQQYETKPYEISKWEAHKKYFDIQYIVQGEERMGHVSIEFAKPTTEYNPDSDFYLFAAEGNLLKIGAGYFTFFAPQDVHMPGVCVTEPSPVKKIVFKLAI
ncbi:MAG: putative beta-D-galactosidase, partial [Paenibacillus sp.]|nr:putative beta-D-galactosidase [Paenibacillus sp.]